MARYQVSRRLKPSGGFELAAWFFMRLSGLLLVFLALGHLFITHIVYNVDTINYAFVASRWASPKTGYIWRIWDLTMINLAVLHGFNGLRQILWEYIVSPGRRVVVSTLIWLASAALIIPGSYSILMFQENKAYIKEWRAKRDAEFVRHDADPAPRPSPVAAR